MKTIKSQFQNPLSAALLLLLTFVLAANAHDVWIEDTSDHQLVIHFGEFGDELETSPGYLDSLSQPQAWTKGTGTDPLAFEVAKQTNSFLLTGASATNFAAAETAFTVLSATNKPSRLPLFYARWQPAGAGAGTPTLTFDLVPQEKPGDIRVYFRGKPLADEAVLASGPDSFQKELKTDATGSVHFVLSTPGFYLFTCTHYREDRFGFSGGRPYDLVSHNASLTLRLPPPTNP
jgi:hypothetical protein